MEDDDLAAIIFLDKHPGWTYDDFRNAPDVIVRGLMRLDHERAQRIKHG